MLRDRLEFEIQKQAAMRIKRMFPFQQRQFPVHQLQISRSVPHQAMVRMVAVYIGRYDWNTARKIAQLVTHTPLELPKHHIFVTVIATKFLIVAQRRKEHRFRGIEDIASRVFLFPFFAILLYTLSNSLFTHHFFDSTPNYSRNDQNNQNVA